jgi:protein TonB
MRVSDCFLHEVRVPRGALGESAFVHVKFAVTADGRVGLFHVLGDVSVPLAKAVRDAVYACEWEFAKDPSGTPSAMWVVIPLRFQGEERPQSLIRPWSGRNR